MTKLSREDCGCSCPDSTSPSAPTWTSWKHSRELVLGVEPETQEGNRRVALLSAKGGHV